MCVATAKRETFFGSKRLSEATVRWRSVKLGVVSKNDKFEMGYKIPTK